MNNVTCTNEEMPKWVEALRREMGMPDGGSCTDAARWFAVVPDEQSWVRLGKLAVESRVDIVMSVFLEERDREPTSFGLVFRTMSGALVSGCIPVAFGKDEPISLYASEAQCLCYLDDRGILARRCGERLNGLQLAHKRAMKRLRKTARTIDLNAFGGRWQPLQDAATIPLSKISKLTVRAT